MKKIGIIGGAGPMAGCQLYKEIINECQQQYGCKNDNDFPEIVMLNYPFSNMATSNMLEAHNASVRNQLTAELQICFNDLTKQKVAIAAIGCNTLHAFLNDVTIQIPHFVHIAQETMNHAQDLGLTRLFILGSQTTAQTNLYKNKNIDCIIPSLADNTIVDAVIKNIMDGNITATDATQLQALAQCYFDKKPFDAIVLGCTELPLLHAIFPLQIIDKKQRILPILDTIKILAKAIVKRSVGSFQQANQERLYA